MLNLVLHPTTSDLLPSLLGILGLLMTWELHDRELRAGHIKGVDLRNLSQLRVWLRHQSSSITMYVHATPNDAYACDACRKTHGTVLPPRTVRRRKSKVPLESCTNPAGCRCVAVGLVGEWPAAEKISKSLQEHGDEGLVLTDQEFSEVLRTAKNPTNGNTRDRIGIYHLEAMRAEATNPQFAISRYRGLVVQAREGNHHPFVVAAYLRLSDLLERAGRFAEALDVVDDFNMTVRRTQGPHAPTLAQSSLMIVRKARLLRRLQNAYRLVDGQPTGH